MSSIKEKVSYLNGLIDGLSIDNNEKEGKAILAIVSVLNEIADKFDEMDDKFEEIDDEQKQIKDYINDYDDDYSELDYLDNDFYDECADDIEEDFIGTTCPNCKETIYVEKAMVYENEKIKCPNCFYDLVNINSEEKNNCND
jgi:hypothetical protein